MSTTRQLMTNSEAQEEMISQYNEAKSQSEIAYRAASEAEKAAEAKYRSAKRQIPQDTKTMEEALAEKAKARSDKKAAKRIMDDYYEKEKAFNASQKSRVYGQGETKQDTIDRPTDTENLSETKEPDAGSNTGSEPNDKPSTDSKPENKQSNNKNKNVNFQLGQGFYNAVAGAVKGDKMNNTLDSASNTAKAQAHNQRNEAANRQMEAQRAQQIASQNPYSEAGKIASVQNDAENRQTINNTSFAAGTAAARLRKTNAPDVQSQMTREDQQANIANQRREEADIAQQGATKSEGQSETFAIKSREYNNDTAESANLSTGASTQSAETDKAETDKTDETDNTEVENTDKTKTDEDDEIIDDVTLSDKRIKDVMTCLSDLRLKSIREAYDRDGCCSPEDFMWLAAHTGGKFNHDDRDYDFFNDDDWSDDNDGSVLSGYADYIKNYVYTYKPEATEIDSRIDPNQEHIGPMAQDIEKVNPACIKETPEGVKTVDTARLAMMNAGAIGDLARQMQDLVDKLRAIGVE